MSAVKGKTNRHSRSQACVVFGQPNDLKDLNLPTYHDVMKHYLFVRQQLKITSNKEPSFKDISDCVVSHVMNVWKRASIPTVSEKRIYDMLKSYHSKYLKMKKLVEVRKSEKNLQKLKDFQTQAEKKLFDASACKCEDFELCSCSQLSKVPLEEREFLIDQRTTRKMVIGSVDALLTAKMKKKTQRKLTDILRLHHSEPVPSTSKETTDNLDQSYMSLSIVSSSTDSSDNSSSSEFEPSSTTVRRLDTREKMQRVSLDSLAVMSDKTGVSDRAAATIASAVLEGAGLVNKCDSSLVVDRNKVRRARKRARSEVQENMKLLKPLESIYFDGRKDTTKIGEIVESKQYVRFAQEEHVVLLQEPGSLYIGHLTPIAGSASCISFSIIDYLQSHNIDTSSIVAVGCDGTAVNTGHRGGVIRLLEEKLNRPLHWFVCLLHANELPLRHLISHYDGQTSGPSSFTGPIGKHLSDCEKLPVIEFNPIPSETIELDSLDLSTDQAYLLQLYRAVASGECSSQLALMKPGKIHHARWLTTASRILRLYISTESPSSQLLEIVNFIMAVYVPVWFSIKMNPSASNGAKHLFSMITKSRSLSDESRNIVHQVLQNNAFFAQHENLLIAMIHDESPAIREIGYRRIIKARENPVHRNTIRKFQQPKLLFHATAFHLMIDWQNIQLTEPPLTRRVSSEDIMSLIKSKEKPSALPDFPCHTQAVERHIKLVTQASKSVVGAAARDGFIRNQIEGRKKLPKFETKKQYFLY